LLNNSQSLWHASRLAYMSEALEHGYLTTPLQLASEIADRHTELRDGRDMGVHRGSFDSRWLRCLKFGMEITRINGLDLLHVMIGNLKPISHFFIFWALRNMFSYTAGSLIMNGTGTSVHSFSYPRGLWRVVFVHGDFLVVFFFC